jgi:hypothetical protein
MLSNQYPRGKTMQFKKLYSALIAAAVLAAMPLGAAHAGSAGAGQLTPGFIPTYRYTSLPFVSAASATDEAVCYGSASKTVYVTNIWVTQAGVITPGENLFYLIKRSTATSGGTSSTLTGVPMDSNNPSATGSASTFTANPTLGTSVGIVGSVSIGAAGATVTPGTLTQQIYHADNFTQAIPLHGVAQCVAVNNNGVTNPIDQTIIVTFETLEQ